MAKLTATQVANKVDVSSYTIKRWYKWYEQLDAKEILKYKKTGMPTLPKYESLGTTNWRCWEEDDVPKILEFKNWVPKHKKGVMGNLRKNKGE